MNFDFSEDQRLLQRSVREYMDEKAKLSVAREVLESDAKYSEALWKGAAELGFVGATVPEQYGGSGFGHLEAVLIAEEVGRALAPIPFSSTVYLATEALLLAGTEAQKERYLPLLASGERIGTLAFSEGPGRPGPASLKTAFEGGRVSGIKFPVLDGDVAGLGVVVAKDKGGVTLALVDLDGVGVERTTLKSIDPSRSQAKIEFSGAPAEPLGEPGNGWELLESILDRAAVLMAFEQIGGAQRAFDITTEYTQQRYAFGRAIGSFQALKHRLADVFVNLELSRSNAYYAAWTLSTGNPELATTACSARAIASDTFEQAAIEMIHMHGGVGFTWEFDCHLFYRRAKLLGLTLGSAAEWREKLMTRLEQAEAS